jgi:hypothetical protein
VGDDARGWRKIKGRNKKEKKREEKREKGICVISTLLSTVR